LDAKRTPQGGTIASEFTGSTARVLTAEVLAKLRVRLKEPPDDGGLWTSAKVAAFIARELGLEKVAVQRGWEALKACGMSIQTPRKT